MGLDWFKSVFPQTWHMFNFCTFSRTCVEHQTPNIGVPVFAAVLRTEEYSSTKLVYVQKYKTKIDPSTNREWNPERRSDWQTIGAELSIVVRESSFLHDCFPLRFARYTYTVHMFELVFETNFEHKYTFGYRFVCCGTNAQSEYRRSINTAVLSEFDVRLGRLVQIWLSYSEKQTNIEPPPKWRDSLLWFLWIMNSLGVLSQFFFWCYVESSQKSLNEFYWRFC